MWSEVEDAELEQMEKDKFEDGKTWWKTACRPRDGRRGWRRRRKVHTNGQEEDRHAVKMDLTARRWEMRSTNAQEDRHAVMEDTVMTNVKCWKKTQMMEKEKQANGPR